MEVTGLAVGVAGLAGLFSVCLDSLSRFQTYRESNSEAHVLDTRFRAARARFEQWGVSVGISDGRLQPDHHHGLDNKETANLIADILQIIAKTICDDSISQRNRTGTRLQAGQMGGPIQSRSRRLKWALGGKESRNEQVYIFEKLVQQLYNLIPPEGETQTYEALESTESIQNILQMLAKIEQGIKSTNDDAFECIRRTWEHNSSEIAPRKVLLEMLKEIVIAVPGCVFIADGLDECSQLGNGDASVARFLRDIMGAVVGTEVRLLLVSRDEPEIREALEEHRETVSKYRIGTNDVQADTAAFSQSVVDRKLRGKSKDLRLAISKSMADKCEGQFLWLKLQEQCLRNTMSKKRLQEVVENTPSGLDGLYDQNWRRIMNMSDQDRDRTLALLRWTAFTFAPLNIYAVVQAVLIDQFGELDPDECPENVDDEYITGEILGLCGPLVEFHDAVECSSPEFGTLHIPHFSVRQYLVTHIPAPLWMQPKDITHMKREMVHHTAIARSCIQYLSLPQVWEEYGDLELYPKSFLLYAAFAWTQHAKLGFMDSSLRDLSKTFLKGNNICYRSFINYLVKFEGLKPDPKSFFQPQLRPLEMLLYGGWIEMADHLFDDTEVNEIGALGRTPIFSACLSNSAELVKKLLQRGADMSITDSDGWTCLHEATIRGFEDIVRILVESNVDLSTQDKNGFTALHFVARRGDIKCYQYLLEQGADASIRDMKGANVIHHTCLFDGHAEILRFILQNGPESLATDDGYTLGSPLMLITHHGDIEMAKVLFEFGAAHSLFIPSSYGDLPLHRAAWRGHTELVELFLKHGAESTLLIQNRDGKTALSLACPRTGRDKLISLLLRPGVERSILMQDKYGDTPLHVASLHGFASYVELILQYSQPVHQRLLEIQNKNLETPLLIAAERGYLDVVKALLSHDAESSIHLLDLDNNSPLCVASARGFSEIVKELLSHGAASTITTLNSDGETALHAVATGDHVEVLKFLLEVPGVPVNQKNLYGFSPLFIASRNGYLSMVELLLSVDLVDKDTENWLGLSPLFAAVANGHLEVTKLLLSKGCHIQNQVSIGGDLNWWAQRANKPDLLQLLEQHQALAGAASASCGPLPSLYTELEPLSRDAETVDFRPGGHCATILTSMFA
ncbi:ankyrin protein [Fusarium napiforme]|uniref:Ankyrin protein n=1 Tax=Fusarium napiforme TaxID=42672 RepID=A0A8H5IB39_9HYPO|nr:ankyrin protein [Fusarium napiforme]